jgi:hypothetical protein
VTAWAQRLDVRLVEEVPAVSHLNDVVGVPRSVEALALALAVRTLAQDLRAQLLPPRAAVPRIIGALHQACTDARSESVRASDSFAGGRRLLDFSWRRDKRCVLANSFRAWAPALPFDCPLLGHGDASRHQFSSALLHSALMLLEVSFDRRTPIAMLVFVDESGDPGFRVGHGSTPIFAAAMVIFRHDEAAHATEEVIHQIATTLGISREFKFNKSSERVRDGFFASVSNCPFIARVIVIRKELIYSPHLMTDKEDFYRFFIRQMMAHDGGILEEARVVIDRSGDREFKKMLKTRLRQQLGQRLKEVRFGNSQNDRLLQLADMCVGAVARSYRTDRKDSGRWRDMIRPRLHNVWDFR